MATIKAIEQRSVHQIQSGQVIIDLCSVVKELVENSLDAGATSIDVRFRNYGLESIEVQDNGEGISPEDYENVALKHHTSKLSEYADLDTLQTFGFRGEALSSLCAVSDSYLITSRAEEAPKGMRLDFETSGKLKGTKVVHSQKGTTVVVENLFRNLPVRRRELEKNIKREYGKVLALLQAYACISTGVKFVVSSHMQKGKKATVFATRGNLTTQENIMNVFGAKTVTALIPLDLRMELQPSNRGGETDDEGNKLSQKVHIVGHISRPAYGEGRQTPQRQMFYVNKRPCGLPQVAKAFNEAHKSYNVTHTPFILADLRLDTNGYDVNVSPDKRTILLHEQSHLLEAIKTSVTELLGKQEQAMPQTPMNAQKLPGFQQLSVTRSSTLASDASSPDASSPADVSHAIKFKIAEKGDGGKGIPQRLGNGGKDVTGLLGGFISARSISRDVYEKNQARQSDNVSRRPVQLTEAAGNDHKRVQTDEEDTRADDSECDGRPTPPELESSPLSTSISKTGTSSDERNGSTAEPQVQDEEPISALAPMPIRRLPGIVQTAFNRMRPRRLPPDTATITIGSKTVVSPLGMPAMTHQGKHTLLADTTTPISSFASQLRTYAASSMQVSGSEYRSSKVQSFSASSNNDEPASNGEILPETEQGLESSLRTDEEVARDSTGTTVYQGPDDHSDTPRPQIIDVNDLTETRRRAEEEARVEDLIREAEKHKIEPMRHRMKAFKSNAARSDSTFQLVQSLSTSTHQIQAQLAELDSALQEYHDDKTINSNDAFEEVEAESAEDRLSLTVSKEDFKKMRLVGQFNLGFILATRKSEPNAGGDISTKTNRDELFIIDQHASDEIYNFERLQQQTVVQSQRLVRPRKLDITAIEEEVVLQNLDVLEKNGFLVEIDESRDEPIGRRCTLVSLPMSREVVFDARDLEELLALLLDAPPQSSTATIVRPSKVRRMFAMRACRSSIMIGRTLTAKQMSAVITHMGEIDKPWNCPHGRPTMRHLVSLDGWDSWKEGDGILGLQSGDDSGRGVEEVDWVAYVGGQRRK